MTAGVAELGNNDADLLQKITALFQAQNQTLPAATAARVTPIKRIQRLALKGTGNIDISAVNMAKTVVILNCESSSWASLTGGHTGYTCENYARLVSNTRLNYSFTKARYSAGNCYAQSGQGYVEVVEFV